MPSPKIDYSKYSDEELQKIAAGDYQHGEPEHGALYNLASDTGSFLKGAGKGALQSVGDIGASVLNAPLDTFDYLTGTNLPKVPHPDLLNPNPESASENVGQKIGELLGGIGLPGGAGLKAVQYANKGYKALKGGKELGLAGKLLAGSAGGAAEGTLTNENRFEGGAAGATFGAAGHAIPASYKYLKSATANNIADEITRNVKGLKQVAHEKFTEALKVGEEAGANQFLRRQAADFELLKKAGTNGGKKGEKDLLHAFVEYNRNPTLTNAHYAQRDLNKLTEKYKGASPGTLEGKAYKEALRLKNNILQKMSVAYEVADVKHAGKLYSDTRENYAKYLGPYLDNPAIAKFMTGKLRKEKLADAILNEAGKVSKGENFIASKGDVLPGLERREKLKKLAPYAQKAAIGAGGVAAAGIGLPYAIKKILGVE